MAVDFVLAVGFFMKFIMVISMICSILLILLVLIQKGKGGGLSSAFGGGMSGGLLGSKTGDFLTWVTVGLAVLFLFFMIILARFYRPTVSDTETSQPAVQQQATGSPSPPPLESGIAMPDMNNTGE
ncbi:MAG: preprotein translocase subunit SecG [Planctomycetota bacterium]|jgi:preprotein translocase subunit SecG